MDAYVFRCGEIKIERDGDLNSLTLTHLAANESINDLRTEESFASMYLKIEGTSYIGLSTTNNIRIYKNTYIDGNKQLETQFLMVTYQVLVILHIQAMIHILLRK